MRDDNKKSVPKKEPKKIDRTKFDAITHDAKLMEKEINSILKNFEKKYGLKCWLTLSKRNQIVIDISIDGDKL